MRPTYYAPGEHGWRIDASAVEAIKNMNRFKWEKTWVFWPRRCRITKRPMWPGATAYKGTRIIHGPGDNLLLVRWLSPEAFTLAKLKGEI